MKSFKLLILFILSVSAFAQKEDGKTIVSGEAKESDKTHLSLIKEKQVGKFISSSSFFKNCKQKHDGEQTDRKKKIRECFMKDLNSLSDDQVVELSDNLGLQQFGVTQTNEADEVKSFIEKRLNKILYGVEDPDGKSFKDLKHVSHDTFNKIHGSALTKAFYRETFAYCLENFKLKSECTGSKYRLGNTSIIKTSIDKALNNYMSDPKNTPLPTPGNISFTNGTAPSTIQLVKSDGTFDKSHSSDITHCLEIKPKSDAEIKAAGDTTKILDPKFEEQKFNLCIASARVYCNAYEKKLSELTGKTDYEKDQKTLNDELIAGTNKKDSFQADNVFKSACKDSNGKAADCKEAGYASSCLIVKKMRNYRKALAGYKKNEKLWKELKNGTNKGYNIRNVLSEKGIYKGNREGEKIDDITTLTSKDIKDNFNADKGKKLKDECEAGDQQACDKLYRKMASKDHDDLVLAHEAQTQVMARKIDTMEKEDLEKFARDNGYHKVLGDIESDTNAKIEELRGKLREKYKAERHALIQEFNKKLKKTNVVADTAQEEQKQETQVKKEVGELVQNKEERLERLYHYSNIVMGYIAVEENGEKKQFNSIRDAELDASGADANYVKQIKKGDTGGATSSSSDNTTITLPPSVIDRYLSGSDYEDKGAEDED